MADKANYVEQIKNIQRQDQNAKEQWWTFCDNELEGVKDPNRHDISILQRFLEMYNNGTLPAAGSGGGGRGMKGGNFGKSGGGGKGGGGYSSWGSGEKGNMMSMMNAMMGSMGMGKSGGGGGNSLQDFIKAGQRASSTWKEAWQAYCQVYGNGMFDPAKYDEKFIRQFIEYISNHAVTDLQCQAAVQGVTLEQNSGAKREWGGNNWGNQSGPSAKRGCWGPSSGGDSSPEKADLVEKIKALQRQDPDAKQAWWSLCDEQLGGVKDPNRHEISVLQSFMSQYA